MNDETIIVLEDNVVTMKGLTRLLMGEGFQVVGVATTNEAINALRMYRADLMILDLTLLAEDPFAGVADGFAFKEWLHILFPDFDLPIIVYTADNSPNLERRAWSHGINKVVRKDAGLDELLSAVREVLGDRGMKRAV